MPFQSLCSRSLEMTSFWFPFELNGALGCLERQMLDDGRRIRWGRFRVCNHLRLQSSANVLDAPVLPLGVSVLAQWEQNQVIGARHEVVDLRRRGGGHDIEF